MIAGQSILLRKIWLWCLIIACGLGGLYLGFISLVSVWIGLGNMHHAGFWVPILAGTTSLAAVLWVFIRVIKRILSQMKQEDVVNI